MIYQYVKRYLKETYEKPSINSSWSRLDDVRFFNYIEERYSEDEFFKNISEVKEAFKDFFESPKLTIANILYISPSSA